MAALGIGEDRRDRVAEPVRARLRPPERAETERALRSSELPDRRRRGGAAPHRLAAAGGPARPRLEPIRRPLDPRVRSAPELAAGGDSATTRLTTDTGRAVTAIDVDPARRIDELIANVSPVIGC